MRSRLAPLALLVVLCGAGCLGASARPGDLVVHVPAISYGESWTTRQSGVYRGDGQSTTFMSATTTTVQEPVATRLDSYGYPVTSVVLSVAGDHEAEVQEGTSVQSYTSHTTAESAIEKAGGNWLIFASYPFSADFANGFCGGARVQDEVVSYAREPIRYDFATLRGHTLRLGDTIVDARDGDHPYLGKYHLRSVHEVVGQETMTLALDERLVSLPVLVVEHATDLRFESGARESTTHSLHRAYYADGFGVPVKTVVMDDADHASFHTTSVLAHYAAGHAPVVFGGEMRARYHGVHPEARPHSYRFVPDMSGVGLEFPLADALTSLAANPRSAQYHLWLQQHPDAYAAAGTYTRLDDGRFEWALGVTDGRDYWSLVVVRKRLEAADLDLVDSAAQGNPPTRLPSSDQAHALPVIDANTALTVARRFFPDGVGWQQLDWQLGMNPFTDQPVVSYDVSHVQTQYSGGAGPLRTGYAALKAPTRSVDGISGAVLSSRAVGFGCGSGLFLELPV
jgi:hypothetical protein